MYILNCDKNILRSYNVRVNSIHTSHILCFIVFVTLCKSVIIMCHVCLMTKKILTGIFHLNALAGVEGLRVSLSLPLFLHIYKYSAPRSCSLHEFRSYSIYHMYLHTFYLFTSFFFSLLITRNYVFNV